MCFANSHHSAWLCPFLRPLQIILAILVSWLLCFIFTVTDVFPPDSTKYGFYARTDARQGVLLVAPWFKVPYPCKYSGQRVQELTRGQLSGVGSWQRLCSGKSLFVPQGLIILVIWGFDTPKREALSLETTINTQRLPSSLLTLTSWFFWFH